MIISNTLKKIFTSQVPKIFKSNIRKNHNRVHDIGEKNPIIALFFVLGFIYLNKEKFYKKKLYVISRVKNSSVVKKY